jgi:hypothetical protein
MTKTAKFFISVITCSLVIACNTTTNKQTKPLTLSDSSTTFRAVTKEYKAIKYVDSFINVNSNTIKKNTALKEHYEGLCTKQMIPLIDTKGMYSDLPFKLVATTIHNGTAYGNFVYDDNKHYVKVTCIIKKEQLEKLQENNQYLINFRTVKFEDGVSFENEFSKIELPTVDAYLTSFMLYVE